MKCQVLFSLKKRKVNNQSLLDMPGGVVCVCVGGGGEGGEG